jgi:hypothetical protein
MRGRGLETNFEANGLTAREENMTEVWLIRIEIFGPRRYAVGKVYVFV